TRRLNGGWPRKPTTVTRSPMRLSSAAPTGLTSSKRASSVADRSPRESTRRSNGGWPLNSVIITRPFLSSVTASSAVAEPVAAISAAASPNPTLVHRLQVLCTRVTTLSLRLCRYFLKIKKLDRRRARRETEAQCAEVVQCAGLGAPQ